MRTLSKSFILGFIFLPNCLLSLHAQTENLPAANAAAVKSAPAGQSPEEATRKIADLVHVGKYAEAQQLTTGLLVAYPDDQRLIKARPS